MGVLPNLYGKYQLQNLVLS